MWDTKQIADHLDGNGGGGELASGLYKLALKSDGVTDGATCASGGGVSVWAAAKETAAPATAAGANRPRKRIRSRPGVFGIDIR